MRLVTHDKQRKQINIYNKNHVYNSQELRDYNFMKSLETQNESLQSSLNLSLQVFLPSLSKNTTISILQYIMVYNLVWCTNMICQTLIYKCFF